MARIARAHAMMRSPVMYSDSGVQRQAAARPAHRIAQKRIFPQAGR
jgi:hypothetical protein